MEDVKSGAWMIRYGASSLAYNLAMLPADRLDWRPEPGAKTAMEMAGEAIRVLHMYLPVLRGTEWSREPAPQPTNLEEARRMLAEAAETYAAALEAAGPELDRAQPMPFGGVFRATRAALYPVMDLFHHHGQICYLQSLLGDREMHWDEAAIDAEFAAK